MGNSGFKTRIGGQAVIEGIAMKGPDETCLAVRTPEGVIHKEMFETKHSKFAKVPLLRGPIAMIGAMAAGVKYLNRAADIAYPDEKSEGTEKKSDTGSTIVAGVLGVVLAIVLFTVVPTALTGVVNNNIVDLGGWKVVVEAVLKIIFFVGYLFAVTRMKEIHRVYEYHGAEHKTIFCYERGMELTVENARTCSRFHPRCGTSFLFIVLLISILVFSFVPWGSTLVRTGIKLLALPVIMGISYEIIQFAGRHDNAFTRILSAPGLWMQRLTTFEPDDSELEVAIEALKAVIPEKMEDARW